MLIDRLWSNIEVVDGCWEWTAGKFRGGYGALSVAGKAQKTHRISYVLHRGEIPSGKYVCHGCDNPACCNPDHLFLGTQVNNMADMRAKARQASGSANGRAKLTEADVVAIRASEGLSQNRLAARYGVTRQLISLIQANKSWVVNNNCGSVQNA